MRNWALVLAACTSPPPPSNTVAPPEHKAAPADPAEQFKAAWRDHVRPTIPHHTDPLIKSIDEAMQQPNARYGVQTTVACREPAKQIFELQRATSYDYLLYGALADLAHHDRCWPVTFGGGLKLDVVGYIDASTGSL